MRDSLYLCYSTLFILKMKKIVFSDVSHKADEVIGFCPVGVSATTATSWLLYTSGMLALLLWNVLL